MNSYEATEDLLKALEAGMYSSNEANMLMHTLYKLKLHKDPLCGVLEIQSLSDTLKDLKLYHT